MSRKLDVFYIVPSRYDDDGYVHRYWRGVVPSNTLVCMKSITEETGRRKELGDDVELRVQIFDDCVQRPPIKRIIRQHRRGNSTVLVGLVAVQSNQFVRAMAIAKELRDAGVPVMIGGFHVSGTLAMFHTLTPELQELVDQGVTLVKGEVDGPGVMASILRDALAGEMKPIYDITESPDLSTAAVPRADKSYLKRYLLRNMSTLDTSRGCPFNCSFCTVINVQGRTMRCRPAAGIIQSVRENYPLGVNSYFFTDDNMARSPVWEELFDGLKALRDEGFTDLHFMMQVDTQSWKLPNFVEKARQAGCHAVFIGLETINPKNVKATGKAQNKTDQFPKMVQAWHDAGIRVHTGYIIGLPHDTPESVRDEVRLLRDYLQVDEASFFMLTPLPGSRDHKNMVENGIIIDADLNNLDSFHETFRHDSFKPGEWYQAYYDAWDSFYSKENIANILLRAPRSEYWPMFWTALWYRWSGCYVRTHPMITGLMRLKDRKARRPIFPRESIPRYALRRLGDLWWGTKVYAKLFWEFQEIWMLSRRPDDPRWATLAELRERFAHAQRQVAELNVRDQCDAAAHELRAVLASASERIRELSETGKGIGRGTRRRLVAKAQEVEAYLKSFEMEAPCWSEISKAQHYIAHSLMTGYEEVAIRWVKKRRRLNAYRQEIAERIKTRGLLHVNIPRATRLVFGETVLAARFWFNVLTQGV